jgi:hypothetical protein
MGGDAKDFAYEIWWRDYMVYFLITKWKEWYRALSLPDWGYDICGVRICPARKSPSHIIHASGNYWAANSEYLQKIQKVEDAEKIDHFQAEMMAFTGQPLIYSMCQGFQQGFPYWDGTFYEWIKKNDITKYWL